jgi:hypothetical protein
VDPAFAPCPAASYLQRRKNHFRFLPCRLLLAMEKEPHSLPARPPLTCNRERTSFAPCPVAAYFLQRKNHIRFLPGSRLLSTEKEPHSLSARPPLTCYGERTTFAPCPAASSLLPRKNLFRSLPAPLLATAFNNTQLAGSLNVTFLQLEKYGMQWSSRSHSIQPPPQWFLVELLSTRCSSYASCWSTSSKYFFAADTDE